MCSLPAAASTLFSDLGSAGSVYDTADDYPFYGSGDAVASNAVATLFTVAGAGSLPVTQIDLAVSNVSGPGTFVASIWTTMGSTLPGSQVAGASWDLSTYTAFGTCCNLVSVTGITGVNLTGGQQYFLILEPVSFTDDSNNGWNWNNQGVAGTVLDSFDGVSWTLEPGSTLGAFDVLSDTSTPEPGSLLLLGAGVIGVVGAYRRKSIR